RLPRLLLDRGNQTAELRPTAVSGDSTFDGTVARPMEDGRGWCPPLGDGGGGGRLRTDRRAGGSRPLVAGRNGGRARVGEGHGLDAGAGAARLARGHPSSRRNLVRLAGPPQSPDGGSHRVRGRGRRIPGPNVRASGRRHGRIQGTQILRRGSWTPANGP